MKLNPRLSIATVELVRRFESFQPVAEPAPSGWSVGYGHTRSAREGAQVSRADAEALLLYDLGAAADAVQASLFAPVSQRQFEALTAFCFNIGAGNFRRSTALARINAGAALEAADEIERWRHAELGAGSQVVDALVRRRAAEKAHFLGLPEGFSKTPTALVRPLSADDDAGEALGEISVANAVSATLSAASNIQARLRELIPDGGATAEGSAGPPPPAPVTIEEAQEPPPFPARVIESPAPEPPPRADVAKPTVEQTAQPLPPPPPPPPANDALEPAAFADVPESPPLAASAPEQLPVMDGPSEPADMRRLAYLVLTALGACLFVAAIVMILAGRPALSNLLLGVIGAVVMIPGVYGLLGVPRA